MAEETKVTATDTDDKDKGSNYVSGDKWICVSCGMSNSIGL